MRHGQERSCGRRPLVETRRFIVVDRPAGKMRFSRTFLARASMGGIDLVYLLWRQLRTTNELFATAKEEDPACNGPGKLRSRSISHRRRRLIPSEANAAVSNFVRL